jgi:Replication-relaxation
MRDQRACTLTSREQTILRDLDRVRLLTGQQIERLHFWNLASSNARGSARRRSLGRLVANQLVVTLPRRVGGERAGSAGLVYSLDSRAQRDRASWADSPEAAGRKRVRRPWPIGWSFVSHGLDVAELYVRLREAESRHELRLVRLDAEPASWYPTATGLLKPDAYAVWERGGWEQHWWIEVDRGTETLPTLRRKLMEYLQVINSGDLGPMGVVPLVLVTVLDDRRMAHVLELARALPEPADQVIRVSLAGRAPLDGATQEPRPPP